MTLFLIFTYATARSIPVEKSVEAGTMVFIPKLSALIYSKQFSTKWQVSITNEDPNSIPPILSYPIQHHEYPILHPTHYSDVTCKSIKGCFLPAFLPFSQIETWVSHIIVQQSEPIQQPWAWNCRS